MVIDSIKEAIKRPTSLIDAPSFALEIIPSGRISGFIASPTFHGMDENERQEKIWGVLKKSLSPEDLASISILLAVTNEEMDDDSKIHLEKE